MILLMRFQDEPTGVFKAHYNAFACEDSLYYLYFTNLFWTLFSPNPIYQLPWCTILLLGVVLKTVTLKNKRDEHVI